MSYIQSAWGPRLPIFKITLGVGNYEAFLTEACVLRIQSIHLMPPVNNLVRSTNNSLSKRLERAVFRLEMDRL